MADTLSAGADVAVPAPLPTAGTAAGDLDGHSALLLLSHGRHVTRVLYLLSSHLATVASGPPARARLHRVRLHDPIHLPFRDAQFDCVVLQAAAASPWHGQAAIEAIVRVLRPEGTAVLLSGPRAGLAWLAFPRSLWFSRILSAACARVGLSISRTASVTMNGQRLTSIAGRSQAVTGGAWLQPRQGRAFVAHPIASGPASALLDRVLSEAASRLHARGRPLDLERVLVRKIGKTALLATGSDGTRYLIRVPRSPVALMRARRNFAALRLLHEAPALPEEIKTQVPRAVAHGRCFGLHYYVETRLGGLPLNRPSGRWVCEPGALRFISQLHLATRRSLRVDEACFERYVEKPLCRVVRRPELVAARPTLERLTKIVRNALLGRQVPLVWTHGDFAPGNWLYDDTGGLCGIVDWELFSAAGLPLIDVVHALLPHLTTESHDRWHHFDRVSEILCGLPHSCPQTLRTYAEALDLDPATLPALMLMYWVEHVASRVDARASDAAWMRRRVHQPLEALRFVLGG